MTCRPWTRTATRMASGWATPMGGRWICKGSKLKCPCRLEGVSRFESTADHQVWGGSKMPLRRYKTSRWTNFERRLLACFFKGSALWSMTTDRQHVCIWMIKKKHSSTTMICFYIFPLMRYTIFVLRCPFRFIIFICSRFISSRVYNGFVLLVHY